MTSSHAFLSYTRLDDEAYDISGLKLLIQRRARAVLGQRDFRIFQDIEGIKVADEWQERLDQAVRRASLFIAVVTPLFLRSQPCRDELSKFLAIERGRGVGPLVLPLYLLTVPELERNSTGDHLAELLRTRQRFDWRPVRDLARDGERVQQQLQALADAMAEIHERAATFPLPPESYPPTIIQGTNPPPAAAPYPTPGYTTAPRLWTPGQVFRHIDAPWCPEMVVVPPGKFTMGSSPEEQAQAVKDGAREEWVKREGPQHRVTIAEPFAIGRYAVTFEEFDEFRLETGYTHRPEAPWGRGRMPVVNVSWEDAQAYCQWLSATTKTSYRLPSEAEWEYACRAGSATRYSWGDQAPGETLANVQNMVGRTSEVGSYPANALNLSDMHGNVWEWCADAWHDSYNGAPNDGNPWQGGPLSRHVLRGGSWNRAQVRASSASRSRDPPGARAPNVGFRVARTLAP